MECLQGMDVVSDTFITCSLEDGVERVRAKALRLELVTRANTNLFGML